MRQEIMDAIAKLQQHHNHVEHLRNYTSKLIDPHSSVQLPLMPEAEQGLMQMHTFRKLLPACMSTGMSSAEITAIYSISGVDMYFNTSHLDHIVVDFSQWGPLVAVYPYGSPSSEVMQQLDICLSELGLIKLSNEEIAQLEEQDLYNGLF